MPRSSLINQLPFEVQQPIKRLLQELEQEVEDLRRRIEDLESEIE